MIVADYRYDGGVSPNGKRLIVSNIQIFRIRGGEIIISRDFHDHAALAAGMSLTKSDARRCADVALGDSGKLIIRVGDIPRVPKRVLRHPLGAREIVRLDPFDVGAIG